MAGTTSSPARGGFLGILAVSVGLVAAASATRAADLGSPGAAIVVPAAPTQPEPYDWTGFYVGAHGGLGFDHYSFKYAVEVPGAAFTGTNGIDGFGPVLGLQIGFNYQIPLSAVPYLGTLPGGLVFGFEIDNSWTGIYGDTQGSGTPPTTQGLVTFGGRVLNLGTARLRIGYAYDRFLVYFTGGFAYGVTKTYYDIATVTGFRGFGASTDTRSGIPPHVGTLGIGVEYAVSRNWTVRAEYMYDGINAHYEVFNPAAGATVGFGTRTMYHIGRLGLNYKFDWSQSAAVFK